MTAFQALEALRKLHVEVFIDKGGRLACRGLKPSEEILAEVRPHRDALVAYLKLRQERLDRGDDTGTAERIAVALLTGSPDLLLTASKGGVLDHYASPSSHFSGRRGRGSGLPSANPPTSGGSKRPRYEPPTPKGKPS